SACGIVPSSPRAWASSKSRELTDDRRYRPRLASSADLFLRRKERNVAMLVVLLDDPKGEFSLSQDLVTSLAQLGVTSAALGRDGGGSAAGRRRLSHGLEPEFQRPQSHDGGRCERGGTGENDRDAPSLLPRRALLRGLVRRGERRGR